MNHIGKEYDGDLVYFYLEIENIDAVNNINIQNNILTKYSFKYISTFSVPYSKRIWVNLEMSFTNQNFKHSNNYEQN